ncbi:aminotransferase class III-fold pyridoxal phosphate-dependent enzyme [Rhodococcus antarcticus]|uniref:Aminotransferase class III-fold pyridoxal phosphate-dependent enzyme n=1 Tax=Rhodococcus antarcticus TaxID=2987751 RepID=A0ABY6P0B4_9NOCA|nr:aminotransferase class III-fold pyridoxal phosphate-dependent enzyme [Rhodococcus antarcticus]UZJ25107.1 aminotransferase class III-fold pyridoxal phosphate-dependent enzyme [Rhodococcus antarcticus]
MSTPALLHPFARPAAEASSFTSLVRGEGAIVWDAEGTRYVDAMASLWHCNVGHGRTEVAEAVAEQIGRLETFHCFDKFTNAPADALAERLAALAPVPGSRVFLTSGGSEAVDTAIKLARLAHAAAGDGERTIIISRAPSYHGVTYGGMSLTGLPANSAGFGPGIGDAVQVPKDDLAAVGAVFAAHPGKVAAVFAEPVIGAGGVHPPVPGYLEGLRALCTEHGAFLVLDEVICAFGRLGSMFAGEHYGVHADLTTFAKGVTSGYVPLGGVLVAPSVHEKLSADPAAVLRHGYTYSGHASACAAAMVCLDITEREGLLDRAKTVGARLSTGLHGLLEDGLVSGVRGEGAVWAVETLAGVDAVAVRDATMAAGVIVRPVGPSTLAMCPPLVSTDDDVDEILGALRRGLESGGTLG